MLNMSSLFVTLLTITFVNPSPLCMCKDADCNLLYTPTTVRVDSCNCSESVHSFVYPKGFNNVYVNYSVTSPISHDFYQDHTLVGSCPTGLLCTQRINLNPTKDLTTVIREKVDDKQQETVLYSNDNYELLFNNVQ